MTCRATPLPSPFMFRGSTDVVRVVGESSGLRIEIEGADDEPRVQVHFERVVAFRVIDEGYLLEYWPLESARGGATDRSSVFEVHEGGWLSQEKKRDGAQLLAPMHPSVREYFVVSDNDCVTALADSPPNITLMTR